MSTTSTTTETTTTTVEGHYWERRRPAPGALLPLAVGAVGLIGLGLLHGVPVRDSIESELTRGATSALAAAGAPDVKVDLTGRDAMVTGELPEGISSDAVVSAVEAVDGIRVVKAEFTSVGGQAMAPSSTPEPSTDASAMAEPSTDASAMAEPSADSSAVAEPSPATTAVSAGPSVDAKAADGKVTLTGKVGSQAAIDALVVEAEKAYGAGNVTNQLVVDPAASDQGLSSLGGVLTALGKDSAGAATLAEGTITLTGTVASAEAKTAAATAAALVTGDPTKVVDQLTVAAAPAAPAVSPIQATFDALPQITFATASSSLTPAGYQAVLKAAAVLKANPAVKVRIEGHTDDLGDPEVNRQLSVGRGASVRQTLRTLGIADDRMSYRGYGQTRPKVPNTSDANRALNRRVMFIVL